MKINIEEKKNGFTVYVQGGIYHNGEYVFKSNEILQMMEFVGQALAVQKVKVTWN